MKQNHKLRVIECFAGIGACSKALEKLNIDFEIVDALEIDKYAIKSFNAIHNTLFPVQDITKWDKDYKNIDLICGGFPCFPAGTLVLTNKGYTEIENVKVGDMVLTHKGRWRKVLATGSKKSETIKLSGNHYGLECTSNHPIYSCNVKKYYPRLENGKRTIKRRLTENKEWTKAKDMLHKYWATPSFIEHIPINEPLYTGNKNEKEMPIMNEAFFYLVGRWIGDGWVVNSQRSNRPIGQTSSSIYICDSYDKKEELEKAISKVVDKYSIENTRTCIKFRFHSKVFCDWLVDNFGKGAINKTLPTWVFSLDDKRREALFNGVCDSDGYKNKNEIKISSISKKLVMSLRLLGESLGYSSTLYFVKVKPKCVIEGRLVNQHNGYVVAFSKGIVRERLNNKLQSWYIVKEIKHTNETKNVYNLEVEEDNSYVADSIVVHNCQDVSIAGKQAGVIKGKTRSGLMYELLRVIEKVKPKFVIAENVKNLLSKKHIAALEEYLKEMESLGYKTKYQVMNAKDYGIPQNRERVFIVSIRNDIKKDFKFPDPMPLKKKLKDLLEDNVDEKYFLSDKLIECFTKDVTGGYPRKEQFLSGIDREIGKCVTTKAGSRPVDNYVRQ